MAELRLKSRRFREEREWDWRRLESLVDRAERKGADSLSDNELMSMAVLYRSALSSLSVARATSLDRGVTDYLESLAARAYFFVYGARSTLWARLGRFFAHDWPNAVKALWRETLLSALIFFGVAGVAAWLVTADPDWYYAFAQHSAGRDPAATTAFLRETLYHKPTAGEGLTYFASFLFTNNATVALLAFALGFAFCVPTALLIGMNGAGFGAFLALFASRGLGWQALGWLMIHGVTELFAAIIAGAAGFRIGWALAFPGERTRIEAAAAAGRTAATAVGGVVVMLFVAGLLEGFGRQLINQDAPRFAIAGVSLVIWLAYFYLPRRGRAGGAP